MLNLGARSSCHRPFWGRWQRARTASARALLVASLLGVAAASAPHAARVAAVGPQSAAAAGDPVIVAAGDIACDPTNSNFNSGNGKNDACQQKWTYNLFAGGGAAAVLLLGDNQYYCGGYSAFLQSYDLSWGQAKSITHPSVGNHEYLTSGGTDCNSGNAGADGYFKYFGAAAGTKGKGYYSYDVGTWHLIAINSNCGDAGGCGPTSPQGVWLKNDLATHTNLCTLAYWHIPLFSSGGRAATNTKELFQTLYDNNADLVLAAHDHLYERFAPQTPAGAIDTQRGIREFVVGTGGANHTSFAQVAANSEVRNDTTYGVLNLTLHQSSYDWTFVPQSGHTFTDSGTTACHGATSDITPPTPPQNLTATASGPAKVDLTWAASTDNTGVAGYKILRDGSQIAATPGTTYTDATAQPGASYTYSVKAYDASNNLSDASNSASVTTPLDTTAPSPPTSLTATAASSQKVNLAWTASNDDVGVSAYQIFRNGTQIGTTSATSYADTTVQPVTTYSYTVIAADSSNNVSAASNTATVTTPPLETTLTITPTDDTYDAQDLPTSNFGSAARVITDGSPVRHTLLKFVVSGVNGRTVTSATLRLSCADPSPAGGEFHAVTTNSWTEGTVTWNTEPAMNPTVLATLGKVSVGTTYQVDLSSLIKGDGTYSIGSITANTDSAQYSSKEDAAGTPPQLVVTTGGTPDTTAPTAPTGLTATAVSAGRIDLAWTGSTDNVGVTGYKIFRDGAQIATSTSTSYSDRTALPSTTYTYTVQAYDAAGNTSPASDPAGATTPADTTAPTVPTNVTAAAAGPTQVNVSWTASTDDVGVSSYAVLRNNVQVGTTASTSFADTTAAPATTYTYTVVALDAAGNASAASSGATVTTPAQTTTLTFTPTDDTYAEQDTPTTNYGKSTQFIADGSPVKNLLVKFSVSGVGNRTVTKAVLKLRCVDPSAVGGAFHTVADTSWTEGTVTWNNAPVAGAATIRSLGAVATGATYDVDLTGSITGDGTYSFEATSASADGAHYSTKEGSVAPQLVLTLS